MTGLQILALIVALIGGATFIMDFVFMASSKEITKMKAAVYSSVVIGLCVLCTLVILGIV